MRENTLLYLLISVLIKLERWRLVIDELIMGRIEPEAAAASQLGMGMEGGQASERVWWKRTEEKETWQCMGPPCT